MSYTYECFNNIYEIPYTTVAILYTVAVFTITSTVITIKLVEYCKEGRCCSCAIKVSSCCLICWVTQGSRWLIRLVFGNSEGISNGSKNAPQGGPDDTAQERPDDSAQGGSGNAGSKLGYIQIDKLTPLEVNIFGAIILCFGLLMAIAAYGVYMLEVSYTCSEDTAIYCFPMLIDPEDLNSTEILDNPEILNIMQEMRHPINDCSIWVNSSIAPIITFQCFRFAYNAQAALATAGGLLTLFTVVMRITITIFLKLFYGLKCIEKYGKQGAARPEKHTCLSAIQGFFAVLFLVIDIGLTFMVASFQLNESTPTEHWRMLERETPTAELTGRYLGENGIQLLVGMGTITLLLLIPWNNYAEDPEYPEPAAQENNNIAMEPISN